MCIVFFLLTLVPVGVGARGLVVDGVRPLSQSDDLSAGIKKVAIDGTRLIPPSALREAAVASGIHSKSVPADAPVQLAARLNLWYRRNGYLFSRVVARGPVRNGRLQFVVSEPKIANPPVAMQYFAASENDRAPTAAASDAPVPTPPSRAIVMQRRAAARLALVNSQLRLPAALGGAASVSERVERMEASLYNAREARVSEAACRRAEARLRALRQGAGLPNPTQLERMHATGALMTVGGSTRAGVVASALSLQPGAPFRWDDRAWEELRRCSLFEACDARVRFVPMPEGAAAAARPAADAADKGTVFVAKVKVGAEAVSETVAGELLTSPLQPPVQSTSGFRRWARRREELVCLQLFVVEKDSRPRRAAQHCRVEPGIALSGGQLAGEVAVSDHNLFGRNQQLKLDVAMNSAAIDGSELRASVVDPRLGHRFGFSAQAFQRPGRRTAAGAAEDDVDDAEIDASAPRPPPLGTVPSSGLDVEMSGRAWRGASVGFGASANLVPTEPPPSGRRERDYGRGVDGWLRGRGLSSTPSDAECYELPVQLTGTLGCGSLQKGGGSVSPGGMQAGARLAAARSLPFIASSPDFWRLRGDVRFSAPLGSSRLFRLVERRGTSQPQATLAAFTSTNPRELVRTLRERLVPPAVAAPPPVANERSPSAGVARALRLSTLNVRGRATVAASALPIYETEALGGDHAIRGYEAEELGRAISCAGATVELTVPLGGGQLVALSLFGDAGAGTVRGGGGAAANELGLSGGAAAGVGLRYGPFRIDYAYNQQGRWKTHVGLVE